jgi:GMP synthase-like glutamine amidotransferase
MRGDKILVLFGSSYGKAVSGLGELSEDFEEFEKDPKSHKLVLFTGGSDVDPRLYGESSPKGMCRCLPERDAVEARIFETAVEAGVKMAGICRGAQFLNVMAGGRLMHHVDGHAGPSHEVTLSSGETMTVNSLHHQMIVPSELCEVVGWSTNRLSDRYFGNFDLEVPWIGKEPEVVTIPKFNCFGAQYHPEMMSPTTEAFKFYWNSARDLLSLSAEEFSAKLRSGKKKAFANV